MSAVSIPDSAAAPPWRERSRAGGALAALAYAAAGMVLLLGLWELGGVLVARNPATAAFAGFAPAPALATLWQMLRDGGAAAMTRPSLYRVLSGLACAIAVGVPFGILVGGLPVLRKVTNIPLQFLRMISPLSWMPIAVMAFPSWDGAIIFLIAVAAVWPILFSTAAGLARVDPAWFKVARNLGARPWHMLVVIVLPAIAQDILTGIRLALGVAWIVLVPAEYLGVTSGLGYAINDARDTLSYDRLGAIVVIIGVLGFALDFACQRAITHFSWRRES